jgi:hypothetical protein
LGYSCNEALLRKQSVQIHCLQLWPEEMRFLAPGYLRRAQKSLGDRPTAGQLCPRAPLSVEDCAGSDWLVRGNLDRLAPAPCFYFFFWPPPPANYAFLFFSSRALRFLQDLLPQSSLGFFENCFVLSYLPTCLIEGCLSKLSQLMHFLQCLALLVPLNCALLASCLS